MGRLNVQADLRARLENFLNPINVYTHVPEDRPPTFVVVKREGGGKLDALRDRPGVSILMWAQSEAKAYALAERVSDFMAHLRFCDGYDVVYEETLRSDPDPQTKSPRYYASYTITTHKI